MEQPILSVVIPVWNQELLVQRALDSIPKRQDVEIVINNDCSTDNTKETIEFFIRDYKEYFYDIKYLENEQNMGVGYTINKCYDNAEGKYVMALGSDDFLYTEEVNKLINELDGTDIVYFNLRANDTKIWDVNEKSKKGLVGSVKCIRREFLGDTRCPDTRKGEDFVFTNKLYKKNPSEKFTHIVAKHYNYPRIGSLSNPADVKYYGLSIIIPVYNTKHELQKLLKKLVYQKRTFYPETEIIIIDDGSKEDMSFITKEYMDIIYIKQENRGPGAARNVGLNLASRTYITFIDSDDDIADDYLQSIYPLLNKGYDYMALLWTLNGKRLDNNKILGKPLDFNKAVWGYVFRYDIIGDIRFDEGLNVREDEDFIGKVLKDEHVRIMIPNPIYHYNIENQQSITRKYHRGEISEKREIESI